MTTKTEQLIRQLRECEARQDQVGAIKIAFKIERNRQRRERDQSMRDLGLVKVRGNLGGTYWE